MNAEISPSPAAAIAAAAATADALTAALDVLADASGISDLEEPAQREVAATYAELRERLVALGIVTGEPTAPVTAVPEPPRLSLQLVVGPRRRRLRTA